MIAGKGLGSFERNGAGDDASATPTDAAPPRRCFAFVQAFDDRPRRRMFEMLRGLDYQPNQKLVMLSDGGESVRTLGRRIGPEAEHVLDWFHVAMRVTALGQMVKGAAAHDRWRDERLGDLERVKQLLWHGHAREAEASIGWIEEEVEAEHDEATGERRAKLKRLGAAIREWDRAAVQAALDTPWTTSPAEGQINRVKAIKRSMYGRAGFPLLRARVLHAT